MNTNARTLMLLALAAGCAEPTFSAHTGDNAIEDVKRTLALHKGSARRGAPMAYLVSTAAPGASERTLTALNLQTLKNEWTQKGDLRSRVYVGGGLVAFRLGGDGLRVCSAESGQVVLDLRLGADEKFVGAAIDDDRVYYVVQSIGAARSSGDDSPGPASRRISSVVAVDRTGRTLWRMPAEGSLGAPAAQGGVVAVPFRYQNVAYLDGVTGKELARIRATDEQVTFVRALGDAFYYGGGSGVYRFDDKSVNGTRTGSTFAAVQLGKDQIRTVYYLDAYQPAMTEYGAFDRNRLLWRMEPRGEGMGFAGKTAVLQSYRYFFAFGEEGKLNWAYAHPRVDVVAGEVTGPAVVFASVDGDIGALDLATGAPRLRHKTGMRLLGATFDADGFSGTALGERNDLTATLSQIIFDPDARFTAVKVFAVEALGNLASKEAAETLLKVVMAQKGVPAPAQKKAGDLLVARKDKASVQVYLDALKTRFDFAEDKTPRGLDVLVRVVGALDVKDALPELAAHLADPATPTSALRDIAATIVGLGGGAPNCKEAGCKSARQALREFLLTYRADPAFLADPSALTIAGQGLWQSGSPTDRRTVQFVVQDARTIAPVQKVLRDFLSGNAPPPAATTVTPKAAKP